MVLPSAASDHYRQQQQISVATATDVAKLWRGMDDDFDTSWSRIRTAAVEAVYAGQYAAAASGAAYTGALLSETDVSAPAVARVNAAAFVGVTGDGRPVDTLLDGAVYEAKTLMGEGRGTALALAGARDWITGAVLDAVRESNRQAVSASIAVRPAVQGWVRMLNPPSCKFCITLAGKWFRWNEGFQSHPGCDCRHIPSQEAAAGDLTIDPYAYFRTLEPGTQDRIFGKADAQAIRDGGDIYRIVNTRSRGLTTAKRSTKTGAPSRMMVDDIYRAARSREEAIAMLTREGYVTGPQAAGGNIRGNANTNAAAIARGRGRGTYRVGDQQVTTRRAAEYDALLSGSRDPLNRSTMTAGERRIYDDFYRAEQALLMRRARTIGGNSADRGVIFQPISEEDADLLRIGFIRRVDRVRRNGTAQEKRLAERLWARYNALV